MMPWLYKQVWDETPRDGEERLSQLVVNHPLQSPLKGHETLLKGHGHNHPLLRGMMLWLCNYHVHVVVCPKLESLPRS